jgi:hypothetical protein
MINAFNYPGTTGADTMGNGPQHNTQVRSLGDGKNTTLSVNPIWIKTQYGICLNAACGGS